MDDNSGCLLGVFCGVVILAACMYAYQSRSINSSQLYDLEQWVEADYPIGNDIAESYRDDNKISRWEFKKIADKVTEYDHKKSQEDLERRAKELAGVDTGM